MDENKSKTEAKNNSIEEARSDTIPDCLRPAIIVDKESYGDYKIIDGAVYSQDGTRLIYYPPEKRDREYRIPGGVSLSSDAFNDNLYLEELFIPGNCHVDNVRIDDDRPNNWRAPYSDGCFYSPIPFGSPNLQSINVSPDNPELSSCGGFLFSKKKQTLLRCPSGLRTDTYCIPGTVKDLGPNAFSFSKIQSIVIEGAMRIGEYCFSDSEIRSVKADNVYAIGGDAFCGCNKLEDAVITGQISEI